MAKSSDIRILKNTVIIYIRMAVTIVVGLVTSRLVLQALGASDVGIYSVVGSTVALVGILTTALGWTTGRFMNIEFGKPDGNPNKMFNICNTIHLGGAALILLVLESVGIWYIHAKLNVPPGKEADTMFVFQVSTIVACLGIANTPFSSIFNVHEKFGTVAIIDIVNTLVKLGMVLILLLVKDSTYSLRLYAVMMSVTTWISFVAYHALCKRRWPEIIRWKFVKCWADYKEVLSFGNYNLLASSSIIARSQGTNMLINAFFGTTINAAYYYASMLQNYVTQFVSNFDAASGPQITQNVGAGQTDIAIRLARRSCRTCIILFLLLFFPLWSELDFLVRLWLGSKMPPETIIMARWTLIYSACATTSAGLAILISALGRIKWYKIGLAILYMLCLPVGYILFKNGFPAHTVVICFVIADTINRCIEYTLLHFQFNFDVWGFAKHAYLRPLMISVIMIGYLFLYKNIVWTTFWGHAGGFLLTLLVTAAVIGLVGFNSEERRKALAFVTRKFKEFRTR